MQISRFKSVNQFFLRAVSSAVLICFVSTNTGWSQPAIGVQITGPERGTLGREFADFTIPQELGTVREILPSPQARSEAPVIIHIQDAHGSYEAQVNIKKIISHLVQKYGINLILVEGAAQALEPKLFRIFKDQSLNSKIADLLAKEGELTGAELFLLDAPKTIKGEGVEDPATYAENLKTFRELIGNKKETQEFIKALRTKIEVLGSRKLNKELRDFLRSWQMWKENRLELAGFLSLVRLTAERHLKMDLANAKSQLNFPMLVRYFKAQAIEGKVDFEKAEIERKKLVEFLKTKKVAKNITDQVEKWDLEKGVSDWKEELPRYFLEHFYDAVSKHRFKFDDYPNLVHLWASLIFQSELEPERLFQEIDQAVDLIFEGLAAKDEERELISLFKDSIVLEKLLLVQLTRDEYETLLKTRAKYQLDLIWERLEAISYKDPSFTAKSGLLGGANQTPDLRLAAERIEEALLFYKTAKKREDFLVSNTERLLQANHARKAILVTGGFHSDGLKEKFRGQHYSYIEIAPRLTSLDGIEKVYHQAVLEQSQIAELLREISHAKLPLELQSLANSIYRGGKVWNAVRNASGIASTEKLSDQRDQFNQSDYAQDSQIAVSPDGGIVRQDQTAVFENQPARVEVPSASAKLRTLKPRTKESPRAEVRSKKRAWEELKSARASRELHQFKVTIKGPATRDRDGRTVGLRVSYGEIPGFIPGKYLPSRIRDYLALADGTEVVAYLIDLGNHRAVFAIKKPEIGYRYAKGFGLRSSGRRPEQSPPGPRQRAEVRQPQSGGEIVASPKLVKALLFGSENPEQAERTMKLIEDTFRYVRQRIGRLGRLRRMDRFNFARRLGITEVRSNVITKTMDPLFAVDEPTWTWIQEARKGKKEAKEPWQEALRDTAEIKQAGLYYNEADLLSAEHLSALSDQPRKANKGAFFHEWFEVIAEYYGLSDKAYIRELHDSHPFVLEIELRFARILGENEFQTSLQRIKEKLNRITKTRAQLEQEEKLNAQRIQDLARIENDLRRLLQESIKGEFYDTSMSFWNFAISTTHRRAEVRGQQRQEARGNNRKEIEDLKLMLQSGMVRTQREALVQLSLYGRAAIPALLEALEYKQESALAKKEKLDHKDIIRLVFVVGPIFLGTLKLKKESSRVFVDLLRLVLKPFSSAATKEMIRKNNLRQYRRAIIQTLGAIASKEDRHVLSVLDQILQNPREHEEVRKEAETSRTFVTQRAEVRNMKKLHLQLESHISAALRTVHSFLHLKKESYKQFEERNTHAFINGNYEPIRAALFVMEQYQQVGKEGTEPQKAMELAMDDFLAYAKSKNLSQKFLKKEYLSAYSEFIQNGFPPIVAALLASAQFLSWGGIPKKLDKSEIIKYYKHFLGHHIIVQENLVVAAMLTAAYVSSFRLFRPWGPYSPIEDSYFYFLKQSKDPFVAGLQTMIEFAADDYHHGEAWDRLKISQRYRSNYSRVISHRAEVREKIELHPDQDFLDLLKSEFPSKTKLKILDVGTEHGYFLYDLKSVLEKDGRFVPEMVGIDPSKETEEETARMEHYGIKVVVDFLNEDPTKIGLEPNSFDLITVNASVLSFDELETIVHSYLAPGGVLILRIWRKDFDVEENGILPWLKEFTNFTYLKLPHHLNNLPQGNEAYSPLLSPILIKRPGEQFIDSRLQTVSSVGVPRAELRSGKNMFTSKDQARRAIGRVPHQSTETYPIYHVKKSGHTVGMIRDAIAAFEKRDPHDINGFWLVDDKGNKQSEYSLSDPNELGIEVPKGQKVMAVLSSIDTRRAEVRGIPVVNRENDLSSFLLRSGLTKEDTVALFNEHHDDALREYEHIPDVANYLALNFSLKSLKAVVLPLRKMGGRRPVDDFVWTLFLNSIYGVQILAFLMRYVFKIVQASRISLYLAERMKSFDFIEERALEARILLAAYLIKFISEAFTEEEIETADRYFKGLSDTKTPRPDLMRLFRDYEIEPSHQVKIIEFARSHVKVNLGKGQERAEVRDNQLTVGESRLLTPQFDGMQNFKERKAQRAEVRGDEDEVRKAMVHTLQIIMESFVVPQEAQGVLDRIRGPDFWREQFLGNSNLADIAVAIIRETAYPIESNPIQTLKSLIKILEAPDLGEEDFHRAEVREIRSASTRLKTFAVRDVRISDYLSLPKEITLIWNGSTVHLSLDMERVRSYNFSRLESGNSMYPTLWYRISIGKERRNVGEAQVWVTVKREEKTKAIFTDARLNLISPPLQQPDSESFQTMLEKWFRNQQGKQWLDGIYLVLGGAAERGVAYIGTLEYLKEHDIAIKGVAGTSAGAIGAALIAAGYTVEEIRQMLYELNFEMFKDWRSWFLPPPLNLLIFGGLYRGKMIEKWLTEKLEAKLGPNLTFKNLSERQKERSLPQIPLTIVATNMTRHRIQIFNEHENADFSIPRTAARSALLPFLFESAYSIKQKADMADGVVRRGDLPMYIYRREAKHGELVVGFIARSYTDRFFFGLLAFPRIIPVLRSVSRYVQSTVNHWERSKQPLEKWLSKLIVLLKYIPLLRVTLNFFQSVTYDNVYPKWAHVVLVKVNGGFLDFALPKEKKREFEEEGYQKTKEFFESLKRSEVRTQPGEPRVFKNDAELAQFIQGGQLIPKDASSSVVRVIDPLRKNEERDLRRLNNLSGYSGPGGFYDLLADLTLAHEKGFWAFAPTTKKPMGFARAELISPQVFFMLFPKEIKEARNWRKPTLLLKPFLRGLEALTQDSLSAPGTRLFQGEDGPDVLRQYAQLGGSSETVWIQFHEVTLSNGKIVETAFQWSSKRNLPKAKTDEAIELLKADFAKPLEAREFQGKNGPEALRLKLQIGSRRVVWLQLHSMIFINGKTVGEVFEWGREPILSTAKTEEGMKLLEADLVKPVATREFQGKNGPETLRVKLQAKSRISVWLQFYDMKLSSHVSVRDTFGWGKSPTLSNTKTEEGIKLLEAELVKEPHKRKFQGKSGPEALRKELKIGLLRSVWLQFHDMKLSSRQTAKDAFKWGREPGLSAAQIKEGIKFLEADLAKQPRSREFRGEDGPQVLASRLGKNSRITVWLQFHDIKLSNGQKVEDAFKWGKSPSLSTPRVKEGRQLLEAELAKEIGEPRRFRGKNGPEALRKALQAKSVQSVWTQFHDMKLANGKKVEDVFNWGRQPTLSATKTKMALQLLESDRLKDPETREFQGDDGLEALRQILQAGSKESVFRQLFDVKLLNKEMVQQVFQWPTATQLRASRTYLKNKGWEVRFNDWVVNYLEEIKTSEDNDHKEVERKGAEQLAEIFQHVRDASLTDFIEMMADYIHDLTGDSRESINGMTSGDLALLIFNLLLRWQMDWFREVLTHLPQATIVNLANSERGQLLLPHYPALERELQQRMTRSDQQRSEVREVTKETVKRAAAKLLKEKKENDLKAALQIHLPYVRASLVARQFDIKNRTLWSYVKKSWKKKPEDYGMIQDRDLLTPKWVRWAANEIKRVKQEKKIDPIAAYPHEIAEVLGVHPESLRRFFKRNPSDDNHGATIIWPSEEQPLVKLRTMIKNMKDEERAALITFTLFSLDSGQFSLQQAYSLIHLIRYRGTENDNFRSIQQALGLKTERSVWKIFHGRKMKEIVRKDAYEVLVGEDQALKQRLGAARAQLQQDPNFIKNIQYRTLKRDLLALAIGLENELPALTAPLIPSQRKLGLTRKALSIEQRVNVFIAYTIHGLSYSEIGEQIQGIIGDASVEPMPKATIAQFLHRHKRESERIGFLKVFPEKLKNTGLLKNGELDKAALRTWNQQAQAIYKLETTKIMGLVAGRRPEEMIHLVSIFTRKQERLAKLADQMTNYALEKGYEFDHDELSNLRQFFFSPIVHKTNIDSPVVAQKIAIFYASLALHFEADSPPQLRELQFIDLLMFLTRPSTSNKYFSIDEAVGLFVNAYQAIENPYLKKRWGRALAEHAWRGLKRSSGARLFERRAGARLFERRVYDGFISKIHDGLFRIRNMKEVYELKADEKRPYIWIPKMRRFNFDYIMKRLKDYEQKKNEVSALLIGFQNETMPRSNRSLKNFLAVKYRLDEGEITELATKAAWDYQGKGKFGAFVTAYVKNAQLQQWDKSKRTIKTGEEHDREGKLVSVEDRAAPIKRFEEGKEYWEQRKSQLFSALKAFSSAEQMMFTLHFGLDPGFHGRQTYDRIAQILALRGLKDKEGEQYTSIKVQQTIGRVMNKVLLTVHKPTRGEIQKWRNFLKNPRQAGEIPSAILGRVWEGRVHLFDRIILKSYDIEDGKPVLASVVRTASQVGPERYNYITLKISYLDEIIGYSVLRLDQEGRRVLNQVKSHSLADVSRMLDAIMSGQPIPSEGGRSEVRSVALTKQKGLVFKISRPGSSERSIRLEIQNIKFDTKINKQTVYFKIRAPVGTFVEAEEPGRDLEAEFVRFQEEIRKRMTRWNPDVYLFSNKTFGNGTRVVVRLTEGEPRFNFVVGVISLSKSTVQVVLPDTLPQGVTFNEIDFSELAQLRKVAEVSKPAPQLQDQSQIEQIKLKALDWLSYLTGDATPDDIKEVSEAVTSLAEQLKALGVTQESQKIEVELQKRLIAIRLQKGAKEAEAQVKSTAPAARGEYVEFETMAGPRDKTRSKPLVEILGDLTKGFLSSERINEIRRLLERIERNQLAKLDQEHPKDAVYVRAVRTWINSHDSGSRNPPPSRSEVRTKKTQGEDDSQKNKKDQERAVKIARAMRKLNPFVSGTDIEVFFSAGENAGRYTWVVKKVFARYKLPTDSNKLNDENIRFIEMIADVLDLSQRSEVRSEKRAEVRQAVQLGTASASNPTASMSELRNIESDERAGQRTKALPSTLAQSAKRAEVRNKTDKAIPYISAEKYAETTQVIHDAPVFQDFQGFLAWHSKQTPLTLPNHRYPNQKVSLSYAISALASAGKIKGPVKNLQFQAGAYEYLKKNGISLDGIKFKNFDDFISWYHQQTPLTLPNDRYPGQKISAVYVARILGVAGMTDGTVGSFTFNASAYERAIRSRRIIEKEIIRIWSKPSQRIYENDFERLKIEFNRAKLLSEIKRKRPVQRTFRVKVLFYAYQLYGKKLIATRFSSQGILESGTPGSIPPSRSEMRSLLSSPLIDEKEKVAHLIVTEEPESPQIRWVTLVREIEKSLGQRREIYTISIPNIDIQKEPPQSESHKLVSLRTGDLIVVEFSNRSEVRNQDLETYARRLHQWENEILSAKPTDALFTGPIRYEDFILDAFDNIFSLFIDQILLKPGAKMTIEDLHLIPRQFSDERRKKLVQNAFWRILHQSSSIVREQAVIAVNSYDLKPEETIALIEILRRFADEPEIRAFLQSIVNQPATNPDLAGNPEEIFLAQEALAGHIEKAIPPTQEEDLKSIVRAEVRSETGSLTHQAKDAVSKILANARLDMSLIPFINLIPDQDIQNAENVDQLWKVVVTQGFDKMFGKLIRDNLPKDLTGKVKDLTVDLESAIIPYVSYKKTREEEEKSRQTGTSRAEVRGQPSDRKPQPSVKGKKKTGVSKWELYEVLKRQLDQLPEETISKLKDSNDAGKRKQILLEKHVSIAGIAGKFLNQAIEDLLRGRPISAPTSKVNKQLSWGGEGRFLVAYMNDEFDYILKTYHLYREPSLKKSVQVKWLEEGFGWAKERLEGLAAPTLVVDATGRVEKEFVYIIEGGAFKKTDIAIIQKKILPLLEHLKVLVRSGKEEKARKLLEEFKKIVILMFRRGVVDTDFGGILANYGVDEKTGKVYIFDFGDLSAGLLHADKLVDFLDEETNGYIEKGLREHVGNELAEYFKANPFKKSDFLDQKGNSLFGVDFTEENREAFKMKFPYNEEEVRKMFLDRTVAPNGTRAEVRSGTKETLRMISYLTFFTLFPLIWTLGLPSFGAPLGFSKAASLLLGWILLTLPFSLSHPIIATPFGQLLEMGSATYSNGEIEKWANQFFAQTIEDARKRGDRRLVEAAKRVNGVKILESSFRNYEFVLTDGKDFEQRKVVLTPEVALPWPVFNQVTKYLLIRRTLGFDYFDRMEAIEKRNPRSKTVGVTGTFFAWIFGDYETFKRIHYYPALFPYLISHSVLSTAFGLIALAVGFGFSFKEKKTSTFFEVISQLIKPEFDYPSSHEKTHDEVPGTKETSKETTGGRAEVRNGSDSEEELQNPLEFKLTRRTFIAKGVGAWIAAATGGFSLIAQITHAKEYVPSPKMPPKLPVPSVPELKKEEPEVAFKKFLDEAITELQKRKDPAKEDPTLKALEAFRNTPKKALTETNFVRPLIMVDLNVARDKKSNAIILSPSAKVDFQLLQELIDRAKQAPRSPYRDIVIGLLIKEGTTVLDIENNPDFYIDYVASYKKFIEKPYTRPPDAETAEAAKRLAAETVEVEAIGYRAMLKYFSDPDHEITPKVLKTVEETESNSSFKVILDSRRNLLAAIEGKADEKRELALKIAIFYKDVLLQRFKLATVILEVTGAGEDQPDEEALKFLVDPKYERKKTEEPKSNAPPRSEVRSKKRAWEELKSARASRELHQFKVTIKGPAIRSRDGRTVGLQVFYKEIPGFIPGKYLPSRIRDYLALVDGTEVTAYLIDLGNHRAVFAIKKPEIGYRYAKGFGLRSGRRPEQSPPGPRQRAEVRSFLIRPIIDEKEKVAHLVVKEDLKKRIRFQTLVDEIQESLSRRRVIFTISIPTANIQKESPQSGSQKMVSLKKGDLIVVEFSSRAEVRHLNQSKPLSTEALLSPRAIDLRTDARAEVRTVKDLMDVIMGNKKLSSSAGFTIEELQMEVRNKGWVLEESKQGHVAHRVIEAIRGGYVRRQWVPRIYRWQRVTRKGTNGISKYVYEVTPRAEQTFRPDFKPQPNFELDPSRQLTTEEALMRTVVTDSSFYFGFTIADLKKREDLPKDPYRIVRNLIWSSYLYRTGERRGTRDTMIVYAPTRLGIKLINDLRQSSQTTRAEVRETPSKGKPMIVEPLPSPYFRLAIDRFTDESKYDYDESRAYRVTSVSPALYVPFLNHVKQLAHDLKGKKVLQINAASGSVIEFLRRTQGIDATGLEPDSAFVNFAREYGNSHSVVLPIYQGSLISVPAELSGQTYDLVFGSLSPDELVSDEVVTSLSRLTVIGGHAALVSANPSSPAVFDDKRLKNGGFEIAEADADKTYVILKKIRESRLPVGQPKAIEKKIQQPLSNPPHLLFLRYQLIDFLEYLYKKRYEFWGLDSLLARRILYTLALYSKNPETAEWRLKQDVIDFKTNRKWRKAYRRYRKQFKYGVTYNIIKPYLRDLPEGALVVDVGAGNNALVKEIALANPQLRVLGTDVYDYHETSDIPNATFKKQTDSLQIPVESGSVDLVTLNVMLHHISTEHMEVFLKEIRRILKPGGQVILIEDTYSKNLSSNSSDTENEITREFINRVNQYGNAFAKDYFAFNDWFANIVALGLSDMPMPFNFHTMEEWVSIFRSHGFSKTSWEHIGFLKTAFHKANQGVMVFRVLPQSVRSEVRAIPTEKATSKIEAQDLGEEVEPIQELRIPATEVTKIAQKPQETQQMLPDQFKETFHRNFDSFVQVTAKVAEGVLDLAVLTSPLGIIVLGWFSKNAEASETELPPIILGPEWVSAIQAYQKMVSELAIFKNNRRLSVVLSDQDLIAQSFLNPSVVRALFAMKTPVQVKISAPDEEFKRKVEAKVVKHLSAEEKGKLSQILKVHKEKFEIYAAAEALHGAGPLVNSIQQASGLPHSVALTVAGLDQIKAEDRAKLVLAILPAAAQIGALANGNKLDINGLMHIQAELLRSWEKLGISISVNDGRIVVTILAQIVLKALAEQAAKAAFAIAA